MVDGEIVLDERWRLLASFEAANAVRVIDRNMTIQLSTYAFTNMKWRRGQRERHLMELSINPDHWRGDDVSRVDQGNLPLSPSRNRT